MAQQGAEAVQRGDTTAFYRVIESQSAAVLLGCRAHEAAGDV